MTQDSDTPLSPFLENQKNIVAQREELNRTLEERQKYSIQPATSEAQKPFDAKAKYVVESFDANNNTIERPVINPLPQPTQRFTRPALLSLPEIRERLVEAGNEIDAAKEKFQSDNASLDAFYAERNALKAELIELIAKTNEKQARLRELESTGTPKDQFLAALIKSEQSVSGIAGSLFTTLSEQAAQRIFGLKLEELSPDGKRDTQGRFRKAFQRFTSGFYTRLTRTAKTATTEQISKRADELLDDVSELLNSEYLQK